METAAIDGNSGNKRVTDSHPEMGNTSDVADPSTAGGSTVGRSATGQTLEPGRFDASPPAVGVLAAVLVAAVAIAFRLPSCGESFWLDELHSAWAVSGSFAEVATRAAVGNQTTGYFHLLWVWSAVFGQGEVAMRMSSVLASALASAILVIGVAWQTRSAAAGLVAGGLLAIDPNGVFFGCELRPYAFVMLYAVLAVWSMTLWLGTGGRRRRDQTGAMGGDAGGAPFRLAMLFWISIAALVHPTSIGVLSLLIPAAFVTAWKSRRLQPSWTDLVAGLVVIGTIAALAMSSLPESWQRRDLWKAFGQATRWSQLWYAWSWVPIVFVPVGLAMVLWAIASLSLRSRGGSADAWRSMRDSTPTRQPNRSRWVGMIPGCAGVLGTLGFFLASYFQWVPLWHRRYYVAALPLMAWTAGQCSAVGIDAIDRVLRVHLANAMGVNRVRFLRRAAACGVAIGLLGFTLWYQGTLRTLGRWQFPVQLRGEAWREATAVVRNQMQTGDVVWLDSQLIEAEFFRDPRRESEPMTDLQREYLSFPLRGPYELSPVVPLSCGEHETWIRHHLDQLPDSPTTVWLISRSGKRPVDHFLAHLKRFRSVSSVNAFSGRPSVWQLNFGE